MQAPISSRGFLFLTIGPRFTRGSRSETSCTAAVDRLNARSLVSIMDNKDLRWVRPEYVFGSDEAEKPARTAKRKATKSERFVDEGQDVFTVAQIASLWQLSTDTIQRMFADEPGVITLGDKNPRGKRKRVTLRIPRDVFERVKRKRRQR